MQHPAVAVPSSAASAPRETPPTDEPGFAARLRDSTKAVHREAERAGFVADLIRARATRAGYALFLRNLVPAYATLEAGLESVRHAVSPGAAALLGAFMNPALRRLPKLVDDLEAIIGPDWSRTCPLLPEAEAYARAIENAATGDGSRLAAHAYARYLGDLSGGQILRPLLARTLQLSPDMLSFYEFPAIADLQAPKLAMRQALDTVAPDSAMADQIVEEAIAAFRHNIDLSLAVSRALSDGVFEPGSGAIAASVG